MLADALKILLATEEAFALKAKQFHWNVEGPDFGQLHAFFDAIHDDVYGATDPTAEYIRALGDYAPGSFERFVELTKIQGQTKIRHFLTPCPDCLPQVQLTLHKYRLQRRFLRFL